MGLGVLTLATPDDYRKAIGLALSLRVSNPGLPIAVACSPKLHTLISPYFDHVVVEDPGVRGFVHKLYLDRYSPFEETFYFDADVLVFRNLNNIIENWRGQAYAVCGNYVTGGVSPFGLDRDRVLRLIGKDKLVHIDGAGHAYFKKSECHKVFDLARDIANRYRQYAGDIRIADEDVMDIALTILQFIPMPHGEFWSRYCSAKKGSVIINAAEGSCTFESAVSGQVQRPYMMHFAAHEAPFVYAGQLRQLFKKFDVGVGGLLRLAIADFYVERVKWPAKMAIKQLLARIGLLSWAERSFRIPTHVRD
jgi:hypothetical protein